MHPSRPVTPLPLGLAPCSSSADVPMAAASSRAVGLGLRAEEGGGRFLSAPRGLVGMFGARQRGGDVRGNRRPPRSRVSWFGGAQGGDGVTPMGMG